MTLVGYKKFLIIFALLLLFPTISSATYFTQINASASWASRGSYATCTHNGKLYVMGGNNGSDLNDVWSSPDGITWTQATSSASWPTRTWPQCISYNNKLWVMGGYRHALSHEVNDVWYSTDDGATWIQSTASASWGIRHAHFVTVYQDKMWVAGGMQSYPSSIFLNDVWYSTDGVNWTQATASAAWSVRQQSGFFNWQGKMWVTGGYGAGGGINSTYYSTDGITWTQASASAGWSGRYGTLGFFLYNNQLWLAGGYDYGISDSYNDIWNTSDGVTWTQVSANGVESWGKRYYGWMLTLNSKVYLIGGVGDNGSPVYNDVWKYQSPVQVNLGSGGTINLGSGGTIIITPRTAQGMYLTTETGNKIITEGGNKIVT